MGPILFFHFQSPIFYLFSLFPSLLLAELQHRVLKLFHWPADSTNSFTTFLSWNPASSSPRYTHYTLPLIISDSLYKEPLSPSGRSLFWFQLRLVPIVALHSASPCGNISLSFLYKHCIHTSAHMVIHALCLYERRWRHTGGQEL